MFGFHIYNLGFSFLFVVEGLVFMVGFSICDLGFSFHVLDIFAYNCTILSIIFSGPAAGYVHFNLLVICSRPEFCKFVVFYLSYNEVQNGK